MISHEENTTRSPAVVRKSQLYRLRPKPNVQLENHGERKQFLRGDSSVHAMLTERCCKSYN